MLVMTVPRTKKRVCVMMDVYGCVHVWRVVGPLECKYRDVHAGSAGVHAPAFHRQIYTTHIYHTHRVQSTDTPTHHIYTQTLMKE